MERIVEFWKKYRVSIAPDALHYFQHLSRKASFKKHAIIKYPDRPLPYFFIVLEGVVGGYAYQAVDEDPILREISLPMDYFTGTAHPFTSRNRQIEYRALTPVTLMQLPLNYAIHGQHHYPDVAELFHVMKQRKINQLRHQLVLYQTPDHYQRYSLFRQLLPELALTLRQDIQYQFLRISKSHFHRIKARYLRNQD